MNETSVSLLFASLDPSGLYPNRILFSKFQTQHYCIPKEPIISKTDFKAEGNLQKDPVSQNLFFIVQFTNSGLEKLKIICERMTKKKLVFVVNGCAIALLDHLKPRHPLQIIFKPESRGVAQIVEALKKDDKE